MLVRPLASAASLAVAAVLLAGCAGGGGSAGATAEGTAGPVAVVASTDVYGDLVSTVGGDDVTVTSIITDPDRDPHEYEADGQNQLAVADAALIVENGAGYDDFMDTLVSASGNSDAPVLNVADISGYDQDPADGEFNEHLWYDFPTVSKLVDEIVAQLSSLDAVHAETFAANGAQLQGALADLEGQESTIAAAHQGAGVAITEPVPLYMLDACGLTNLTPPAFSEAIEEDTDVAADVVDQTVALFTDRRVALLAYNEQTAGAQTELVLNAADQNAIPVVPVTETLPDGETYLSWMQGNLDAIAAALGS